MSKKFEQALLDLLVVEKDAIIAANFSKLKEIAPQKAALFAQLSPEITSRHDLAQINRAISQNQTLLQSAISGLAAARARLAALKDVNSGLRVYNGEGTVEHLPLPANKLDRQS